MRLSDNNKMSSHNNSQNLDDKIKHHSCESSDCKMHIKKHHPGKHSFKDLFLANQTNHHKNNVSESKQIHGSSQCDYQTAQTNNILWYLHVSVTDVMKQY